MFAHSFAFEKFSITDGYADKAKYVSHGLDSRLKDKVHREYKNEYKKKNGIEETEDD